MKPYHAKSVTENAHKIAGIRCEIECANELILQNGKLIGVKFYHAKSLNWTKKYLFQFQDKSTTFAWRRVTLRVPSCL
jgi:hypothetical protein